MSRRHRDRRAALAQPGSKSAGTRAAAAPPALVAPPPDGLPWREQIAATFTSTSSLWDVSVICVIACLALGIVEFVGSDSTFVLYFPYNPSDSYFVLRYKAWWVGWILLSFLILPAAVMSLLPGNRLRDCNLSFEGFRRHFRVYVVLFLLVIPVIWLISLSPTFTSYYPMYPQAGRSWFDLLAWESLYFVQFVALEFFFRGFLVGGLSRHIGVLSVPVSVMPYLMLHFTKPWPEASASVLAGFVLGWLAWKTKSIWGGVCIHCAVACSMDLLALTHKSQLPWLRH